MAHVQFRTGSAVTNGKKAQLIVDGVDITDHVFDEGFAIERVGEGDVAQWGVRVVLAADALEVDLPAALLAATVDTGGEVASGE